MATAMAAAPAAAPAAVAAAVAQGRLRMEIDSPSIVRKPGRGFQTSPAKDGGREAAFLLLAAHVFGL